uniref:Uncharacterized protein n=1 Tax=Anopheles epiroticus TaxID=199890 RepID=A0A182PTI3_9DIPT
MCQNYSTVEYQTSAALESGCNSSVNVPAIIPGKGLITAAASVSCYRTNVKIPPIGTIEHIADKQRKESNAIPVGSLSAKRSTSPDKQQPQTTGTTLSGGTRTGSTIVLISTKISNPTAAKLGSGTIGATIKTTGTLYNIPPLASVATNIEPSDNRHQSLVGQDTAKTTTATGEEGNGLSDAQSTSKTATILVSKHKTKTGLPLLLKKSKK